MKYPIDRITKRWRRKQEQEQVRHTMPSMKELLADAPSHGFTLPSKRKGASPSRIKRFHEHGINPKWSKARRERNKVRALRRTCRRRLPHGRQTQPARKRPRV
jgi:hypothetical protein